MEQAFFREYAELEDTHWWFRGRRALLGQVLEQLAHPRLRIVDVGFGTGAMLDFLARYGEPVGIDGSLEAIAFARTRSSRPMIAGDMLHIPLCTGSVDLVTAFDVIEHLEDDATAIGELARICRPGGHVLITVPAFPFLWGNQDAVSHHKRRYTGRQLGQRVAQSGLRIQLLTYFNTLLFPLIAAVRIGRRLSRTPERLRSDFSMTTTGRVNDLLAAILGIEGRLIKRWRLPFGVSLLCLAQRKGT